jgi:putative endonuclease
MRTVRQRRGQAAEAIAASYILDAGWRVVGRNVKVGRDEIDIVAIDPGPPAELVCVEVRSATSSAFGSPEERVDRAKVRNLYRAMRSMPAHLPLQRRVDLLVVDGRGSSLNVRHLRRLEPV